MEIKRTALVLHPAMEMYRLVRDVHSYPDFLSWCVKTELHEQTAEQQLASLWVRVGGMTQKFTTRNRLLRGERMSLALVDGPFRHLSGEWRFEALGGEGSKISLLLDFDFSNTLLSAAFRRGFTHIADKLVFEFCKRADELHGL